MRVFGTSTSAGTYFAFGPISTLGSRTLTWKGKCIQPIRSLSFAWKADLALNASLLTPFEPIYTVSAASSHAVV